NLTLGRPGKGGAGTTAGTNGVYPSMIFSGGMGGSPSCCTAGANGGSFTLSRGKGVPALPNGVKILLDAFGIGGAGGSNCGMAAGPGASGGNLFNEQNTAITFQGGAFDGGSGGSGTPPAAGGPGGKNMPAGTAIGAAGSGGQTC
ncbi:MAG TPA: hypothetical protein VK760_08700, partial [Candidatus Acidoferrales bacterium]|nr:hypothetical protein [Candidatus Acidoferrales bacterium]